jgi:hypothetical protein
MVGEYQHGNERLFSTSGFSVSDEQLSTSEEISCIVELVS